MTTLALLVLFNFAQAAAAGDIPAVRAFSANAGDESYDYDAGRKVWNGIAGLGAEPADLKGRWRMIAKAYSENQHFSGAALKPGETVVGVFNTEGIKGPGGRIGSLEITVSANPFAGGTQITGRFSDVAWPGASSQLWGTVAKNGLSWTQQVGVVDENNIIIKYECKALRAELLICAVNDSRYYYFGTNYVSSAVIGFAKEK